MPVDTPHFTGFAHVRGAGGLCAALNTCIGPQNRQTMARGERRFLRRYSTIIFSTCDRPMNALTGSMRGQIGAPCLLNCYAEVPMTTRHGADSKTPCGLDR
jgi:hypothetical protein